MGVFSILLTVSLFKYYLGQENSQSEIWGPGLQPDVIVMPARYFFLRILNNRCSEKLLDVNIEGTTFGKRNCRIWKNILNTRNCTFIVRYKLYETCANLKISIKYDNVDIGESPYIIKNRVYYEGCDCPQTNLNKWLHNWECGEVSKQIIEDLSIFKSINFEVLREKIIATYNSPGSISLCHYVIKNNKIHRRCYGKYVGFKMFMDNILLSLSRKLLLPDVEFFVNLGDWPLVKKATNNFPIFSWCGSTDTFDIVMPTYDITESTLENMGRVTMDILSVQGNIQHDWKDRLPIAFWKGRDSNRERLHLIELARNNPHLFNVSLTNFFFFRSEEDQYGPKTEHTSFFKFFDYKYQLTIDGTVAAYRVPYLLAGGSLVIKQKSKYYEHFYNELIPDTHYVSVENDLSDLVEKIKWALNNDAQAKTMADAGRTFVNNKLLPQNIFCYHVHLLKEFSNRIASRIEILENMELVKKEETNCECYHNIRNEL
ncbi:hypothetical protein FQA39_LY15759 [Lamprigera yunnana]|nr:hypothetical protein FQA39_LY15759 [Lamprigera yunnana]